MIGYLRGKVAELNLESMLVDVHGVGYEVLCSTHSLSDFQSYIGEEVIVWIHTHVREDAFQLFGFRTKDEKDLFLSLLKVNGVGPKSALTMLSGARANDIRDMIESGNAKALSALPKIGKKTAEQIILTLKGKLVRIETEKEVRSETHKQITSALVNLGFKPQTVEQFVLGLPKDIQMEEGVRQGLATLSSAL